MRCLGEKAGVNVTYNKALLEKWSRTEDWISYLVRMGAFETGCIFEHEVQALSRQYDLELDRRIRFCRRLLLLHKDDPLITHTLSTLRKKMHDSGRPQLTMMKGGAS